MLIYICSSHLLFKEMALKDKSNTPVRWRIAVVYEGSVLVWLGVLDHPWTLMLTYLMLMLTRRMYQFPGLIVKKALCSAPTPPSKLSDVPQAQVKTHLRNLHYMRSFKTSGDVCPPPDFTSYPMTTKESDDIFSERSQHSGNLRHFLRDRSKGPPHPFPCAQVLRTLLRREDEQKNRRKLW